MKYLGKEKKEVVIMQKLEYVCCDKCGKKIDNNEYYVEFGVGQDCITYDTYDTYDYCLDCAKEKAIELINSPYEYTINIDKLAVKTSNVYNSKERGCKEIGENEC